MKKIKIAILIAHMKDGGAQRIVLNNLLDLYNDSGLDIRLFVFDMKNNSWCEQIIDKNRFNTYYLYPSNKINSNNFVNKIVYRIKFIRKLKRFAPNIIHGHITPLIRSTILPIIISKPKYIFFTLHSNPFRVMGYDKFCAKFGFNKLRFMPVCLNEEQAKMAQQHYGFKHYEILHNGVDFEKIRNNIVSKEEARKLFNENENSFVLCACGRLDKVKNYPLMLDIFKKVLEIRANAVLLIAGEGTEKESLINYSVKLGIKEKIRFLGNLDNPIPLYCASDVFLLTSHSESSSLVLMEAQTCDCKCIISAGVPKESIITNKVVSMKENASIEEWTNAIFTENVTYEKPRFTEADYEVHAMSQKCKEMYLRYLKGEKDE